MFIRLTERARTLVLTPVLTRGAFVASALWALGCTGPQTQTPAAAASNPAPRTSANSPTAVSPCPVNDGEAAEQHQGTLRYSEPPRTMSVEAYQHVEFALETPERKLNLAPSPRVSWEALKAVQDRQVNLCCVWRAGATPSTNEAAPMGPDGQPLARPSTCEVSALTPIASK